VLFIIPNIGARGVLFLIPVSGYNAFDAACPNQTISCSTMTINGLMRFVDAITQPITCSQDKVIAISYETIPFKMNGVF
jgi:hypothetical protein